MTRALLVDAGGVLFNNVTEDTDFVARLAARHDVDPAALRREIDLRDAQYETDSRHVHDVLADSLRAAGARRGGRDRGLPDGDWVDAAYRAGLRAHTVVFDFLRDLRARSPRPTIALANNEARHWDKVKDEVFGHLALFDVIGSSWRLGAVKPEDEYFARLCDACGCAPEDALLVDDNRSVIDAAARFGIRTWHVTEVAALPQVLTSVRWTSGRGQVKGS